MVALAAQRYCLHLHSRRRNCWRVYTDGLGSE